MTTASQNFSENTLLSVVGDWAKNRLIYPGWLIAPERSRDHLFDHTVHWIKPILKFLKSSTPIDSLLVLDELNWRLEVALAPLWTDLATATDVLLEQVNPFPLALDLPMASLKPTGDNVDSHPWPKLGGQWIRLAFALLRFNREERQRSDFEKWWTRLSHVQHQNSEAAVRLVYERCLFHLAWSNDDGVRSDLTSWPSEERDPIWTARKAALLAELGDLSEASKVADLALQHIRMQGREPDDISSLSREGWIMKLVHGLESQRWFEGRSTQPNYRGRWEYLARFRCDPWTELEFFDEKFEQLSARRQPRATRHVGFQPGTYSRTYHLGDSNPDLTSAYQFMRLTEEAASPPYCGRTSVSGKSLEMIAVCFSDIDPVRTRTLLCRLDSTKLADQFLTRSRVAALPVEIVKELKEIGLTKIDTSERLAATPEGAPRDNAFAVRARHRLATGIDLLARMAVRLSPEDCNRLLTRAIELYQSEALKINLSLPRLLSGLFESLILGMTPDDIRTRLLELMALPVPGSAEFQVQIPHDWPDFLYFLPEKALEKIRQRTPQGWARQVERLIETLRTASSNTRGQAAMRLQRLNEYGVLTKTEVKRFAKALWHQLSPESGLPVVSPYRQTTVLDLPEPTQGIARTKVRALLTSSDILRVRSRTVDPDGREHWTYAQYSAPDSFLLGWLTTSPTVGKQKTDGKHISWKQREIVALFQKIQRWWNEEGRALAEANPPSSPFAESMSAAPARERFKIALDVLRDVVLASISPSNRIAKDVVALIRTFGSLRIATHAVQPALLKFSPGEVITVAETLHEGLVDVDENVYLQAVIGLIFWLRSQERVWVRPIGYDLPRPPDALKRQLGCNMAGRRQPGLRITLDALGTILHTCPGSVDDELLESITIGLEKLHAEAAYRTVDDDSGPIPGPQIPEYRRQIARILKVLVPAGSAPPLRLAPIYESISNDPLPEVRAAFHSDDEQGV